MMKVAGLIGVFLISQAAGSSMGSAGHAHKNAGNLVSTVIQMNSYQSSHLISKLKDIKITGKDVASLVLQGGLQWLHDLTKMDDQQQLRTYEKLERYEDSEGLSGSERDLFGFAKAIGEYARETKGTDEYPPKVISGYMQNLMKAMGSSSDLVKQVEDMVDEASDAVDMSQPAGSLMQVEHWDEGGGTLIPKKFASTIMSFSQKLNGLTNIPTERRDMLDGMAKKFTAAVLVTLAKQQQVAEQATAL